MFVFPFDAPNLYASVNSVENVVTRVVRHKVDGPNDAISTEFYTVVLKASKPVWFVSPKFGKSYSSSGNRATDI